jgi:hypothetical protein
LFASGVTIGGDWSARIAEFEGGSGCPKSVAIPASVDVGPEIFAGTFVGCGALIWVTAPTGTGAGGRVEATEGAKVAGTDGAGAGTNGAADVTNGAAGAASVMTLTVLPSGVTPNAGDGSAAGGRVVAGGRAVSAGFAKAGVTDGGGKADGGGKVGAGTGAGAISTTLTAGVSAGEPAVGKTGAGKTGAGSGRAAATSNTAAEGCSTRAVIR